MKRNLIKLKKYQIRFCKVQYFIYLFINTSELTKKQYQVQYQHEDFIRI